MKNEEDGGNGETTAAMGRRRLEIGRRGFFEIGKKGLKRRTKGEDA